MDTQEARDFVAAKKVAGQVHFVQLIRDYQEIFSTKAGERVLEDLMQQSETMEMTPLVALQHPHMMSYATGKRDLYTQIIRMMREDPDLHEARIKAGETAKEEESEL